MSDIGAVKEQLSVAKAVIDTAPYAEAAKAFNGLEIEGGDVFAAKLGALVANLKDHQHDPFSVYAMGDTASDTVVGTQESDEGMKPEVLEALGHLDTMKDKATHAHVRAQTMTGLAEKAVGLYAQFTSTMAEFEVNRVQGEKELNESLQGGQLAKQSLDVYASKL